MTRLKLPLLFLIVMVAACSRRDLALFKPATWFPKEVAGDTVTILSNTVPANVLENLKLAYNRRLYPLYESLLTDDYRFYMSYTYQGSFNLPGATPPDPAQWTQETGVDTNGVTRITWYKTREQDLSSARRMLDPAGLASDIELFFQANPLDSIPPDTVRFEIRNIELKVSIKNSPMAYTASDRGSLARTLVTLVRGSDGLWRICRWFDNTAGSADGS